MLLNSVRHRGPHPGDTPPVPPHPQSTRSIPRASLSLKLVERLVVFLLLAHRVLTGAALLVVHHGVLADATYKTSDPGAVGAQLAPGPIVMAASESMCPLAARRPRTDMYSCTPLCPPPLVRQVVMYSMRDMRTAGLGATPVLTFNATSSTYAVANPSSSSSRVC
jgi:hypothetical protein